MPAGVTGPCPPALVPNPPAAASVTAASAKILDVNPARTGLRIVNTSTSERCSLGMGQTAVLDSGLTLFPNGGVWNMDEFDFTTGEIYAVGSGALNLSIQEYE